VPVSSVGSKCARLPEGDDLVKAEVPWVRVSLPRLLHFLVLMPVQCDPCTESKVACHQMLGAGPGFPCEKCYKGKQECKRSSSHYCQVFTRQSHAASNSLPPPVLWVCCTSHAASNMVAGLPCQSCSPPVVECPCPSRDTGNDIPSPAYELLVGRDGRYAGLDSVHAALFWHSKLKHSEAMIDASYHQRDFHCKMLNEALMRCMVPPPDDGPRAKCVKFSSPPSPRGRTHFSKRCTDPVEEEELQDQGKGRADPPVSKGDYESVYSGNAEDWFGL
jgi:hypothetical protein